MRIRQCQTAAYFGIEQERGGGVINSSPFIPSNQMYLFALEKLDMAIQYAPGEYEKRVVRSLIARIYLFMEDYVRATDAAQNGLRLGDIPMEALFITESPNTWYNYAGAGRTQLVMDQRFNAYRVRERRDSVRIALVKIFGQSGGTFYRQNKYPEDKSPIPFLTWQENNLILSEIALRNNQINDAVTNVNAVRTSYGLAPMTTTMTLDSIYVERDKQLCCTGNRLVDQRRFDKWHLSAGTWRYLPITQSERTRNPNL